MRLPEIAHSRTGDKGDTSNISLSSLKTPSSRNAGARTAAFPATTS
jgi:hypothetical protein